MEKNVVMESNIQAAPPDTSAGRLHGVLGRPYLDLEPYLDLTDRLAEIDEEICLSLIQIDPGFAGGSLRTLRWAAPGSHDGTHDAGEIIAGFSRAEFARFLALADDPGSFDLEHPERYRFGDVTDHPFSRKQMLYLKYRYGVAFPWSVAYEMIPWPRPGQQKDPGPRSFTQEALAHFPKTIALIQSLPIRDIKRCAIYGLDAHAYGPLHRDCVTDEEAAAAPQPFILLSPRGDTRAYVWEPAAHNKIPIRSRAYWYNDRDYHGIEPDPFFRYSIQIDGRFEEEFIRKVQQGSGSPRSSEPEC
ncbi:MAG: hypothetical protein U1A78_41460 [Polyangia bacterium]